MSKPKMIKPIEGFTGVSDADVHSRGTNVQTCMTGNANFPTPPVDLAALWGFRLRRRIYKDARDWVNG